MIWLPYKSFQKCLDVLTEAHCEDVLQEGLQALRWIAADRVGVAAGDQIRMWAASGAALLVYVRMAEQELQCRGQDPDPGPIQATSYWLKKNLPLAPVPPEWLGNKAFHLSQRSHLIRVDPVHYAQRLPLNTPLELPLVFPKGSQA